jgi:hypothetical protein
MQLFKIEITSHGCVDMAYNERQKKDGRWQCLHSVMAFHLCQQQWPQDICVNNDGFNKKVLAMASWVHSAHKYLVC